jgi:hypothetical protein
VGGGGYPVIISIPSETVGITASKGTVAGVLREMQTEMESGLGGFWDSTINNPGDIE